MQTIPGFEDYSLAQWHDYKAVWNETGVYWYIDDVIIRSFTSEVPDQYMSFRASFWRVSLSLAARLHESAAPSTPSLPRSPFLSPFLLSFLSSGALSFFPFVTASIRSMHLTLPDLSLR